MRTEDTSHCASASGPAALHLARPHLESTPRDSKHNTHVLSHSTRVSTQTNPSSTASTQTIHRLREPLRTPLPSSARFPPPPPPTGPAPRWQPGFGCESGAGLGGQSVLHPGLSRSSHSGDPLHCGQQRAALTPRTRRQHPAAVRLVVWGGRQAAEGTGCRISPVAGGQPSSLTCQHVCSGAC